MAKKGAALVDDSTREITTVAKEFVGLALVACVVGVVFPVLEVIGSAPAGHAHSVGEVLAVGGRALYAQVGWAYGVAVTALLGLFVATWGGQLFGDLQTARTVRRTLGFTGEAIAALSVPVLVFVICYCSTSQADWAGLVVVLPVFGLIVFLGLQLGRFSVLDRRGRLANLQAAISKRDARMRVLERRSRHRAPAVLGVATLVPAVVVLTACAPVLSWGSVLSAFVADAAFLLVTNSIAFLTLRSYQRDLTRSRWLVWVGPIFALLVVLIALVFNAARGLFAGAVILASLTVLCLVSTFLPRRIQPRWMLDWTIGGVAAASAYRLLHKAQAAAWLERDRLAAEIASEIEPGSWRTRLIGLLERGRLSNGEERP